MKRNYQADLIKHLEDEIKFLRGLINQPVTSISKPSVFKSGLELVKDTISKEPAMSPEEKAQKEAAMRDLDSMFNDTVGVQH